MVDTIKDFIRFLIDIFRDRTILWGLAKNDVRAKFASSLLGIVWAFVQPLVTILVFWFVFQAGFKNPPVDDAPFIVWFVPAYLVWAFFSEVLSTTAGCMREYSYLLKKVDFRVSIIPLVKIISSAYVHIAFIVLIFLINLFYGIFPSVYNLQVIYYFICTIYLLTGLGWFLSAIAVFIKDTVNLVNVFIQIGFWMTPIFWAPETMDPLVLSVLKLNPMFYICQGYRETFVTKVWFWEHYWQSLYFWICATLLFAFGAVVFKKLRPHFVDML
ncbi:ABC transporter permease [Angelakisella massiliensis]|uniref:ABC transporter permease n=1 Tax=Angelakisella massiliensis TaxID=1871018 RepID=UPI0008F90941|nr:ABC transporter permease [Angelakisella massiliensis]